MIRDDYKTSQSQGSKSPSTYHRRFQERFLEGQKHKVALIPKCIVEF